MSIPASRISPTASPAPEGDAQPDPTHRNYDIPLVSSAEARSCTGAVHSSKRSHEQIEPGESSQHSSERSHNQSDTDTKVDQPTSKATSRPHEPTSTETSFSESCPQISYRPHEPTSIKTSVNECSKRPRHDSRRLLNSPGFDYRQRSIALDSATPTSTIPNPKHDNHFSNPSPSRPLFSKNLTHKFIHLPNPPNHLLKPSETPPPKPLPAPIIPNLIPNPTPPRPTFAQLAAAAQLGTRVLFLIDHATKSDALHHHLQTILPPSSSSSTALRLLMRKCRSERSHLQNRYFAKARTICLQLVSAREFLDLVGTEPQTSSDRARRLAYFTAHCTTTLLATLHRPLASAIAMHTILLASTPNAAAFKTLMTQVFIHSMEDLWSYEFQPSQQGISATMERENREAVYERFKGLTSRVDGLPAARDLPGYWEVPLRAGFPRYVLFGQGG
ncbi:MAG: hypothetical protein ASARMPREDX12_007656 [Alectoria sarmentosa]|nr:MAG: hypothetical protein ASARMPREDX12_007656 [Alectoria sarmentosa]